MLRYLVLAGLFYALSPGILLSVPKKASKNTVALTHAVIYTGAYYVLENLLGVRDGFQSGGGLMDLPPGADPQTIINVLTNNSSVISTQIAAEAAANGTSTPLYLSLTAIKDQYSKSIMDAQALLSSASATTTAPAAPVAAPVAASVAAPVTAIDPVAAIAPVALTAPITTTGIIPGIMDGAGAGPGNIDARNPPRKQPPVKKEPPKPKAPPKAKANPATSPTAIIGYVIIVLVVSGLIGGAIWYVKSQSLAAKNSR
jgi:hypothetical protein